MSKIIQQLEARAELAEQKIRDLEEQIQKISISKQQQKHQKQQIDEEDSKKELNENIKKPKEKQEKKVIKEENIPYKIIKEEMFEIKEELSNARMNVTIYNGELHPPFISSKGIKWLRENYESNNLDIFVDTYAKCGTTLAIKLVYSILKLNNIIVYGANEKDMSDPWNAVPWIEAEVSQEINDNLNNNKLNIYELNKFNTFIQQSNHLKQPRIWKTHSSWFNFPIKKLNDQSKIIHVTRNPKDVVCSYFNFFQKEPLVSYQGDFNTLFEWFCQGTIVHSNFFEFELQWWNIYNDPNYHDQILWLSFEELVRNPKEQVIKTCQFLNIQLNNEQIEQISKDISFNEMKSQAKENSASSILMNKGEIGGWKSKLSTQQSNIIDRIVHSKFKHSNLSFIFE